MRDVSQILAEVAQVDEGFCNPLKIEAAADVRADAVAELEEHGFSREEAERMISEAS